MLNLFLCVLYLQLPEAAHGLLVLTVLEEVAGVAERGERYVPYRLAVYEVVAVLLFVEG